MWETLEQLHPTRIGHGVRSSEDAALLDVLKALQIHLEVCPTSNIQTNMYETYADHPIDMLYKRGISLSVNTDTRTITPRLLKSTNTFIPPLNGAKSSFCNVIWQHCKQHFL